MPSKSLLMMASSEDSTIDASCCRIWLARTRSVRSISMLTAPTSLPDAIAQRRRVGHERHARAVRPLGHRFDAAHRLPGLQGDRHRAFVVRQRRAVRPVQLPGAAPFALADLGMAAPQLGGRLVVEGDAPVGVGHVDGGGQRVGERAPPVLVVGQGDGFGWCLGGHSGSAPHPPGACPLFHGPISILQMRTLMSATDTVRLSPSKQRRRTRFGCTQPPAMPLILAYCGNWFVDARAGCLHGHAQGVSKTRWTGKREPFRWAWARGGSRAPSCGRRGPRACRRGAGRRRARLPAAPSRGPACRSG